MTLPIDRRRFIKTTGVAGLGLGLAGRASFARGMNAPNEKVVAAVMGVNGRGGALAEAFARIDGTEVGWICDVDERAMRQTIENVSGLQERKPEGVKDVRELLDNPDLDALVIATPDHWHAPATLMALDAGKHVYVEKPCGHGPREGEMLVEGQRNHADLQVQMGTQQRSDPRSIEVVQMIQDGIIGRPYYGKAWYANTRGPVRISEQPVEVPAWLDWELWQGPAPRVDYRDGYVHYDWHWFRNWGTGEACNNGTHEVDVCRWALGVDYPTRATSNGGRYHYDDDWEFYDTQVMSFDFEGEKAITWEGRSCNGFPFYGRGRGSTIHGTEGTVLLDRDGYIVYDLDGNEVQRRLQSEEVAGEGGESDTQNTVGAGDMTDLHIMNFRDAVREGAALNAPIDVGHKSVLLCHLGNIAQRAGRSLNLDPSNGHILRDEEAMALWDREYADGWAPKV